MTSLPQCVNDALKDRTPSQIILITVGGLVAVQCTYSALADGHLWRRSKEAVWRGVRSVGDPLIQAQVKKAVAGMTMPAKEGEFKSLVLPEKSRSEAEVLELVRQTHTDLDQDYEKGGFSGAVYHGGRSHTNFMNQVTAMFQWSNPLHSDIFGATRKMEAEVVSMVVHMFNGDKLPDACGCVTSGGTESIMMALKTYRDWARSTRGITNPSIVLPITAHPAFDKGAEYFGLHLIKVPIDSATGRVVPEELEKYIRFDTIAIVGSAPNFPHGVVDPIDQLAEIAYKRNIGMHVDCCLGGFIMPFLEKTGRTTNPIFDFRNRGVTSISCDTHKYGYAPKGTSTVLYRSGDLRKYQFCCVSDWPGGLYCSPAVSGSKPGNVIAATWAAMVRFGLEGYVDACNKIVSTREYMTTELGKLPFVYIIGEPTASVFAFSSKVFDIYALGAELSKRGWVLNRLQFPSGLQFSVTMLQTNKDVAARFVKDVAEIGERLLREQMDLLAKGEKLQINQSSGTLYGTAQRIPDRSIVKDVLREFLGTYYRA